MYHLLDSTRLARASLMEPHSAQIFPILFVFGGEGLMGVFELECGQVYLLQKLTPRFGEGKAEISSLMQRVNIREAERIVLTVK